MDTKLCPFCGEEIKVVAVRCRYCHATLDGSTPAPTRPGGTAGSGGGRGQGGLLLPGTVVDRYEIVRLAGKGGMGAVYEAVHQYTHQRVALKGIWPNLMAEEATRRRFLEEGRTMARLKHPGIVGLHDFLEADGVFYLVMDFIDGSPLDEVEVSSEALVPVLEDIVAALAHTHGQDPPVVHRDIKPSNIMVTSGGRAVVTDFGIAKVLGGARLTRTAGVVGTMEYMSPEQVMGAPVAPASDVYSVGVVAYELITGAVPFPQTTDLGTEAMDGHRFRAPAPIRAKEHSCPGWLAAFVSRCLAKDPGERYPDGAAALAALQAGPQAPAFAPVPDAPIPNRRPVWVFIIVFVCLILAAAAMVWKFSAGSSPTAEEPATASPTLKKKAADTPAIVKKAPEADACVPSCESRECGPNECGGSCGDCLLPARCTLGGACVCVPSCEGRECGPDGCGGSCGDCVSPARCTPGGVCVCVPSCEGRDCGPDGCGSVCGACGAGLDCTNAGRCTRPELFEDHGITWVRSDPAGLHFARSETTVAQYRACVEAGKCEPKHHKDKSQSKYCNWGHSDRDAHPMNCVDWYGAEQFCGWAGGRLPSEKEWEAEAGAGGIRQYPWGSEEPTCTRCIMNDGSTRGSAWSEKDGCGENRTWPVCSKRRGDSVSGLCDMAGNVREWTSSWYDATQTGRVMRGGSWGLDNIVFFRASAWSSDSSASWSSRYGFRCVVSSQ